MKIIEYKPDFAQDFKNLNLEWVEKYFVVEDHDIEQLENPEAIIKNGGKIFFAREHNQNVGTATLINMGKQQFELAKMAVTQSSKGKGIGNMLMEHCISEARKEKGKKIVLLSNRSLTPAIALYKKYGFVEVPVTDNPYARGNIKMELQLI